MAVAFYGVKKGKYGAAVYTSWDECKKATFKVSGAAYKRFESEAEAKAYAFSGTSSVPSSKFDAVIYTAGACVINKKARAGGYAAVFVKDNEAVSVVFGPLLEGKLEEHNVATEMQAVLAGLEKAKAQGMKMVKVVYVYPGIGAWLDGDWKASAESAINYRDKVLAYRNEMEVVFQSNDKKTNTFHDLAVQYANKGMEVAAQEDIEFDFPIQGKQFCCPGCGAPVQEDAEFCEACGLLFDEKTGPVLMDEEPSELFEPDIEVESDNTVPPWEDAAEEEDDADMDIPDEVKNADEKPAVWHCQVCGKELQDGVPFHTVGAITNEDGEIRVREIHCCSRSCVNALMGDIKNQVREKEESPTEPVQLPIHGLYRENCDREESPTEPVQFPIYGWYCENCDREINPGDTCYRVKVLGVENKKPVIRHVMCCSRECAEKVVDESVEFLSLAYDQITSQNIHESVWEG